MAEFSAAAELEITVPQSELRSARQQIERELGDVEVGVSGRTMAPDGGTSVTGISRGQRAGILDAQRQSLGVQSDILELAEERNELLRDIEERSGGGGGGFAGPFGLGLIASGAAAKAGQVATAAGGAGRLLSMGPAGIPLAIGAAVGAGTQGAVTDPRRGPEFSTVFNTDPQLALSPEVARRLGARLKPPGSDVPSSDTLEEQNLGGPNVNVDQNNAVTIQAGGNTFDISGPLSEQEIEQIVNNGLEGIRRDIERLLDGSGSGTTTRTGGATPTAGGSAGALSSPFSP